MTSTTISSSKIWKLLKTFDSNSLQKTKTIETIGTIGTIGTSKRTREETSEKGDRALKCSKNNYVTVTLSDKMISDARRRAESLGALNNSILKGGGNFTGYLGEELVNHWLSLNGFITSFTSFSDPTAKIVLDKCDKNTLKKMEQMSKEVYNYDLVAYSPYSKKIVTFEVKSKKTSFAPKPHYECSVCCANTKQKADFYIFVRVNVAKKVGWVLGICETKKYYDIAKFMKKGTFDTSNNFTCLKDCWNLRIDELTPLRVILSAENTETKSKDSVKKLCK